MNEADRTPVRDELLAMADQDLTVRAELAADGSLFHGYKATMQNLSKRRS